jgi:hypothetical protein
MNYFDTLEKKRSHVKRYDMTRIPPKEMIERALWKAWKTSPSKNQSMAYQCLVWGPDKEIHKEAIHNLVTKSHRAVEEKAVEEDRQKFVQEGKGQFPNPYYEHVAFNPYLFTIHSRVSTPNKYYERQVAKGHHYEQGFEDKIEKIIDSVAVEVGIFAANLGYYLLEEGLDIAYNSCFRRRPEEWHKVGLTQVKHRPITMITCGYASRYRRQDLKARGQEEDDRRPEINEIVKWM